MTDITLREYNRIDKLELLKENDDLKNKLATICIALGISGQEAKRCPPKPLRLLVKHQIKKMAKR